jgi:RNA polymerase sigma-70 factor (ECF subfamily)
MPVTSQPTIELPLEAHRRELVAFCYRMLGSLHDAEDAVQETMLRAWRAADRYDDTRASVRTWLYRIATNVCLTAATRRSRQALPSDLRAASDDPRQPLVPSTEVAWLQPLPDALVADQDPAATATHRVDLRLALVAAMQRLPARQRAAVILREALACPVSEIAELLDTTTPAVNSALQRARATLAGPAGPPTPGLRPDDARCRQFVDAYVEAFERADPAAITALVTADVILEMPPVAAWFAGPADYREFMVAVFERRPGAWRLVPTRANGQPALVAYSPGPAGTFEMHSYQVLDVTEAGIRRMTVFYDQALMAAVGVPAAPDRV